MFRDVFHQNEASLKVNLYSADCVWYFSRNLR